MQDFDLKLVEETLASSAIAHVDYAASFNAARQSGVHTSTFYVLSVTDDFKERSSTSSLDIYDATHTFAVMIVIPCMAGNFETEERIKNLVRQVREEITGKVYLDYQAVKLAKGQLVELNTKTNNYIYQQNFKVSGYLQVPHSKP
ncbi:MAG: hypothetical protein VX100_07440 [Pseudomonadota bacterium]|nr:hypothetical protein [Pseudomonadota bacterium]